MAEQESTFRDFGILPVGLKPPAERVRSCLSTGRVAGPWIGTFIIAALGVVFAVVLALTLPLPLGLLGPLAALVGFAAFVHLTEHNDYRWIELEGNTLRARRFFTGRTIERSIQDINCLGTMVHMVYQVGGPPPAVIEELLGRVKGVEIRFRDQQTPLRILRADPAMTHAEELIEAVLYRMRQLRELETEVVHWGGQPLVRRVWWKGEQPSEPTGVALKLGLALLIFFALAIGAVCGFVWLKLQEHHDVGKLPPHELDIRALIADGPGANRHITLTGFEPGGYTVQSKGKLWTDVWVALFPAGVPPAAHKGIKVVVSSKNVPGEAVLRNWLSTGRLTGVCSAAPRTNFGTTLGPLLVQANGGCALAAAWSMEELLQPPSAAEVTAAWAGSAGCFMAVLLLAALVFWKAR